RERPHDLKRSGDAHAPDLVRPQAAQRTTLEHNASPRGRRDAGHEIDKRGLARAVWPDKTENLPRLHVEAHVLDGHHAAVTLRRVVDFENRRGHTRWATRLRAKIRQVS